MFLAYLINVICLLVGLNLFAALPIAAVTNASPTRKGIIDTEAIILLGSLTLAALAG